MTESISYRLKGMRKFPKHWDKAMDKIIEVNLARIAPQQIRQGVHHRRNR